MHCNVLTPETYVLKWPLWIHGRIGRYNKTGITQIGNSINFKLVLKIKVYNKK